MPTIYKPNNRVKKNGTLRLKSVLQKLNGITGFDEPLNTTEQTREPMAAGYVAVRPPLAVVQGTAPQEK